MEDAKLLDEILETVTFIKDNAITKEEFNREVGGIKAEIKDIKTAMVTKEYLDDKLADLRGDLVVMMRKEDTKLKTLVEILGEKKLLSTTDKQRIFALEPFAQ